MYARLKYHLCLPLARPPVLRTIRDVSHPGNKTTLWPAASERLLNISIPPLRFFLRSANGDYLLPMAVFDIDKSKCTHCAILRPPPIQGIYSRYLNDPRSGSNLAWRVEPADPTMALIQACSGSWRALIAPRVNMRIFVIHAGRLLLGGYGRYQIWPVPLGCGRGAPWENAHHPAPTGQSGGEEDADDGHPPLLVWVPGLDRRELFAGAHDHARPPKLGQAPSPNIQMAPLEKTGDGRIPDGKIHVLLG